MKEKLKSILSRWDVFFLCFFSFLTRFSFLSYPARVVFDEAHFGLYATKYLSHQYYFDIHPPLGKMILALAGFLAKVKPGFYFETGSEYYDFNFLALRFLPALFGSLLVLLVYFFVREIGLSRKVAFLSGFMIIFDNALLVQSRFILLDIFLIFFIFLSLLLFYRSKKALIFSFQWYFLNILLGFSLGAAISIKWTGLFVVGLIWLWSVFKDRFSSPKEFFLKVIFLFLLPFLFYFLIFVVHLQLLSSSCLENCGYVLEKDIQNSGTNGFLFNNPPAQNLLDNFLGINKIMLATNLNDSNSYIYQSNWWGWPLMTGKIKYSSESTDSIPFESFKASKAFPVYFSGNPIVWWFGLAGMVGLLFLVKKRLAILNLKLRQFSKLYIFEFLFLGYLIHLLPFLVVTRFMLMYHYLPALVFLIIMLALFIEEIMNLLSKRRANIVFFLFLILVFLGFIFSASLTYGFSLMR